MKVALAVRTSLDTYFDTEFGVLDFDLAIIFGQNR
jgi:hypothetical protein